MSRDLLRSRRLKLGVMIAVIILAVCAAAAALAAEAGVVTTDGARMYSKRSTRGKVLLVCGKKTPVAIISEKSGWYEVTYGSTTGYMKTGDVTMTSRDDLVKQLKKIGKPKICEPGSKGSEVKKLQRCLMVWGFYTVNPDGVYGDATIEAVKSFQKSWGMSQDGRAGKLVIEVMFGADPAAVTPETERLDWFNGGSEVIPKGAVFTVKDCRTGKTFRCKRWSGANHLDAMPLTKDDTAVMKSIYGKWSWNRRPILVMYNNRVFAASMNGMPHGTTTIRNNNFPGHFCIHFYGSKTHGTKRVDKTHQNCVATAMKYDW